jgi:hypothetical protein
MQAEQFYLVCTGNTNLVIQAGASDGQAPTLQPQDSNNPLQLWVMQAQVSGGYQGVALVNPATGNSATYQGQFESLIMQPYSPGSGDSDSFLLFQGDNSGDLRIALAKNTAFSWNDYGGKFQVGDPIYLWNDTAGNSVWTLQLAGVSTDKVAVPHIVGEQAAAVS